MTIVHQLQNDNYTAVLYRDRTIVVCNNLQIAYGDEAELHIFGFDVDCRHMWQMMKIMHKEGTLDTFIGRYIFNG